MPTYRGGLQPNQIGATTDREMVEDVSIQPQQSIHLPGPSPSTEAGLHAREVHDQVR